MHNLLFNMDLVGWHFSSITALRCVSLPIFLHWCMCVILFSFLPWLFRFFAAWILFEVKSMKIILYFRMCICFRNVHTACAMHKSRWLSLLFKCLMCKSERLLTDFFTVLHFQLYKLIYWIMISTQQIISDNLRPFKETTYKHLYVCKCTQQCRHSLDLQNFA